MRHLIALGLAITLLAGSVAFATMHPIRDNTSLQDNLDNARGKVTAVRPEKNELVISENVKDRVFQLTKNATVSINGRDATLKEVKAGDDAEVAFTRDGQKLIASAVACKRQAGN